MTTIKTIPLCSRCIYFEPNIAYPAMSQCLRYGLRDLTTGKIAYPLAKDIRKNDRFCGSQGRLFEPIEQTDRM